MPHQQDALRVDDQAGGADAMDHGGLQLRRMRAVIAPQATDGRRTGLD
jgi:hypothetical protein